MDSWRAAPVGSVGCSQRQEGAPASLELTHWFVCVCGCSPFPYCRFSPVCMCGPALLPPAALGRLVTFGKLLRKSFGRAPQRPVPLRPRRGQAPQSPACVFQSSAGRLRRMFSSSVAPTQGPGFPPAANADLSQAGGLPCRGIRRLERVPRRSYSYDDWRKMS